ncbi:hypothetical protein ACS0TY_030116 [Phlomoides rotata]
MSATQNTRSHDVGDREFCSVFTATNDDRSYGKPNLFCSITTVEALARNMRRRRFSYLDRIPGQVNNLRDLVDISDEDYKKMLHMDRV